MDSETSKKMLALHLKYQTDPQIEEFSKTLPRKMEDRDEDHLEEKRNGLALPMSLPINIQVPARENKMQKWLDRVTEKSMSSQTREISSTKEEENHYNNTTVLPFDMFSE